MRIHKIENFGWRPEMNSKFGEIGLDGSTILEWI
jgi:hypothetical protein